MLSSHSAGGLYRFQGRGESVFHESIFFLEMGQNVEEKIDLGSFFSRHENTTRSAWFYFRLGLIMHQNTACTLPQSEVKSNVPTERFHEVNLLTPSVHTQSDSSHQIKPITKPVGTFDRCCMWWWWWWNKSPTLWAITLPSLQLWHWSEYSITMITSSDGWLL